MALSNPRIIYGVHSFTPYSRTTKLPYGTVLALGASSFSLEGELVSLTAGANKYPWAVEESTITAELSLTLKEYPDFLFELFLGKAPTANAAETSGSVTTLTDVYGGSVVAATGLASAGLKSGQSATVKFGYYVVKAASTTTVDVYAMSNVDAARGTDFDFQNDALKITASPLSITTGAAVEIPGTGIELTGGAGTIGMTTGDTAVFQTRPVNSKSMDVTVGSTIDVFPEFGAICVAKQRGNGEMLELDIFRCKAVGLPIGLSENEFSEAEVKAQAYYDSSQSGVFKWRHVSPT
jgi:hypothetical protein